MTNLQMRRKIRKLSDQQLIMLSLCWLMGNATIPKHKYKTVFVWKELFKRGYMND